MPTFPKSRQLTLLDEMTDLGYGQSEVELDSPFARRLLPVPEHLRAVDPDVVLVVGDRGAGKSALFKAIFGDGLLSALLPHAPDLHLPSGEPGRLHWVPGYPLGAGFPDERGLRAVLGTAEDALALWFAYLVRILESHIAPQAAARLQPLLSPPGGAPDEVLRAFHALGNAPLLALDALDLQLQEENRWLFVGYDELDTLGNFRWDLMARGVEGLVAFWAGYARRWKRLRPKVFLRSDLFERHAGLGGADLAKLAANRVELKWNDRNLFAMLIKRIANTSEGLFTYCRRARVPFFDAPDAVLGWIPNLRTAEDARPLIERTVGPYMGADHRKGQSFTWILDHLRDARGRVSPRALVRLVERTATRARSDPRARPPALWRPTDLRQALEDVSADHVEQAMHEWPWLAGVRERLSTPLAPWERRALESDLDRRWSSSWGGAVKALRPPVATPKELVDYLISLGVLRDRAPDRVDAPDIFLFGLGCRRKGGVQAGRKRT